MLQLWLFASYVLLFITTGADALVCRNCISVWPMAPCLPLKKVCYTSSGVCIHLQAFGPARLENHILSCLEKEQKQCGSLWEDAKTHLQYKMSCCSDEDLCNWKPFLRPWKNFNITAYFIQEESSNNRSILATKTPTQNSADATLPKTSDLLVVEQTTSGNVSMDGSWNNPSKGIV